METTVIYEWGQFLHFLREARLVCDRHPAGLRQNQNPSANLVAKLYPAMFCQPVPVPVWNWSHQTHAHFLKNGNQ